MNASPCRLCAASGQRTYQPWDSPLIETDLLRVVPSLGALVEGWLLIVPKEHLLRLTDNLDTAMLAVGLATDVIEPRLAARYGSGVVLFEHGPHTEGLSVGCTVDHAHLHAVPTDLDLLSMSSHLFPGIAWTSVPSFLTATPKPNESYLELRDQAGRSYRAVGSELPSQAFRRCIAHALHRDAEWNWRDHPQIERVLTTIRSLDRELSPRHLVDLSG